MLFNNTNSPVWVGKTALIETDDDLTFSNHMTRLRIFSAVEPMFVAKQLHFLCSQGYFRHHCKKHVNQASIATDFLSQCVPVRIPPAVEQRRIVAKIEALQERSQRAREAIAKVGPLLEQFRQSVLVAALHGDLTADWRAAHPNVEPASELLHRIRAERRRHWEQAELTKYETKGQKPLKNWEDKYEEPQPIDDTDLPELQGGWVWAAAEEIAWEITVGHVGPMQKQYLDFGIPFLRSQNVRPNRFDSNELKYISDDFHSKLQKSRLQAGDLVVVRSGDPGTACVIPPELADANCADLVIVRLLNGISPYYVSQFMNSWFAKLQVHSLQVGVAQQHFNVGAMKHFPIPIAPKEEQGELLRVLIAFDRGIVEILTAVYEANTKLDQLDQSILTTAFRGELVPQDPNDEPASVLLARIREQKAQQAEAAKDTKKTANMQRRDEMRKKSSGLSSPYRPLAEVLITKGQPMPPQQLLTEAGYDDDSIEDFYFALREEIAQGRIQENRLTESDVMLEAVKP